MTASVQSYSNLKCVKTKIDYKGKFNIFECLHKAACTVCMNECLSGVKKKFTGASHYIRRTSKLKCFINSVRKLKLRFITLVKKFQLFNSGNCG